MSQLVVQQNEAKFLAEAGDLVTGSTGFEGVSSGDLAIPFLAVANPLSKALQPGSDLIEGLKAGDLYCKASGKIYGAKAKVILVGYSVSFSEKSKDDKQKTVGIHTPAEVGRMHTKQDGLNLYLENGNELVDTRNFFVLDADAPDSGVMILSLQRSSIPMARLWLTKASRLRLAGKPAPIWSHVWELGTSYVKADKGSYYAITATEDMGLVPTDLIPYARAAFDEVEVVKGRAVGVEE